MALHKHNGKWYCDAKDLQEYTNLSLSAIKVNLYRGKRGTGGFLNIKNQNYNRKNSKRLVLLESLPPELRKEVEGKLRASSLHQKDAMRLLEEDGAPAEDIASAATQITSEAILSSQPALIRALKQHIDATSCYYLAHYTAQGFGHGTAMRYARTCALVRFLYDQEKYIETQNTALKECQLQLQSLHTNVMQALRVHHFQISVPQTERRYTEWWHRLRVRIRAGSSVQAAVLPLRQDNQNRRKLHADVCHYIDYLYSEGSALSSQQIHEHLVEHAKDMGWFLVEGVFKPPTYRTVAHYVEHRQADLVLARQGDSALFANYLPQIERSLPTEKNVIWGADGTAHNELVFHKGRTRQYVYGVYIFDYASAKLLACAPYSTAGGKVGESAKHYTEALSAAIQSTQCAPQILQIDRGPAYTEVKKWCGLRGIKVIPAGAKNARAKLVENLLGRLQHLVVRYREGWSGQNLTASGRNSHPSPEQLKAHAQAAPTAEEAMHWMTREQLTTYNQVALKTFGGQPCGKTPEELWQTLSNAQKPLSISEIAMYAGASHQVKFTKAGLTVYHNGLKYTYFPKVDSETAREEAVKHFSALKTNSPVGSKLTLYIIDYKKGAYIWEKPFYEKGKALGFWPLKERVSMVETLQAETSPAFRNMQALQRAQRTRAQEAAKASKEYAPFNKERLQREEMTAKRPDLSDKELHKNYTEMVHPQTGEVFWVRKKILNQPK